MERQGASVADRPRMVAAGEMLGGGLNVAFAPFRDTVRRMRRYVVHITNSPYIDFERMQSTSYSSPA